MMSNSILHRAPLAMRVALLGALAACGSSSTYGTGVTSTPPATFKVDATPSLSFTPSSLSVTAGDTVTFAFGTVAHNVFFDPQNGAPADVGGTNAGVSVTRAFSTPGTYRYTCHIHPSMSGTVVVQARATN